MNGETIEQPARIAPVPRSEWTEAVRDVFGIIEGPAAREEGSKSTVIPILANHPDLAVPFLTYNKHLLFASTLPPRLRELVILRVVWRYRCEYEWRHHVMAAPRVGITQAECEALTGGNIPADWAPLERHALQAADQLCEAGRLDDDIWDALARDLDKRQLMDLLFTVGAYASVSWAFNAIRVPLEPGVPRGFDVAP